MKKKQPCFDRGLCGLRHVLFFFPVSTIAQAKGQASIKAGFFFWQTARLVGVIRQGLRDTRTVGLGLRGAGGGEVRTLDRTSDGCCGSGVGKQYEGI